MRRALLAGTALTFVALPAQAQVAQNWTGNVSSDWFDGNNWESLSTPAAGDSVTIDAVTPNPTIASGTAIGYAAIDLNGVNVGFTATGNLSVNNGASFTVTNNNFVVGGDLSGVSAAANGTVVFDNASLNVTGTPATGGTIFVGASGTGSFTAQNGSTVDTVDSYAGHLQGANGTVTVDNSTWTNSRDSFVGNQGTGVFTVQNGGTVTVTRDTVLGADTTGNGTINISGAGSAWTTTGLTILGGNALTSVGGTGTLYVSNGGAYTANGQTIIGLVGSGAMNITGGGQVSSTSGLTYLGFNSGSSATVVIDGAGSVWNDSGSGLVIGGNDGSTPGGNATVTVRNGGTLATGDALLGTDSTGTSSGTVTVTGLGSAWNAGSVFVGWDAIGTVDILDRATFVLTGDLSVGTCNCSFGTMNVGGGSTVTIGGAWTIGEDSGGTGVMTVTGGGSSVTATGDLQVGSLGNGTLNVQDGASATAANAYVGFGAGSNGTFSVTGAGSAFTATGDLTVGDSGTGTLNVRSGGSVTAVNGIIGNNAGANGTISVAGAGATLTLTGGLSAGLGGVGTGELSITDGGVANVTGNVSNGDRVTVGAGSVLNAGNYAATSGVTTTFGLRSSSSGQIDASGGVAALAGALVIIGHNKAATTYTLVTSSNLGGTSFDSVTYTTLLQNPVLTYTAGNVVLTVDAFKLAPSLPSNATDNQRNIAQAIDNVVLGGGTLPAGFDYVYNLSGDALLSALTQLSGEIGSTPQQAVFTASNQFMNVMFDQGGGGPGGGFTPTNYAPEKRIDARAAEAYAAVTPRDRRVPDFASRWGLWASGYGGSSTVKGDAGTGSSESSSRVFGLAAGAEYRFTPDTVFGFALGGGETNFGADGGSGRADILQLGAYARHRMGAAYVSGGLAYGWQSVSTDRTVTTSGTDRLAASFNAQTLAARLESGYRYATTWGGLTPYAALQSTSFFLPSYSETAISGSNQFALSYASQTTTNLRTELGLRTDKTYLMADGILALYGRAAWAHDSSTDRPATATFQTLPGANFTVHGAQPAADGALLSAGAEMKWRNGWSLAATFDGEFSRSTASYAGRGTVRSVW